MYRTTRPSGCANLDAMTPQTLIETLWIDYARITPDAARIHGLLEARGEQIVNDHIALRTFDLPAVAMPRLQAVFEALGWRETGRYRFEAKRLDAVSLSHDQPGLPRVFISQLRTADLSEQARGHVARIVATLTDREPERAPAGEAIDALDALDLLVRRPTWPAPNHDVYLDLLDESEYAAWLAAFGIRANHFTVSVNALDTFDDLRSLNAFLREAGFALNGAGDQIQGSVAVGLEQSSTVASPIRWSFGGDEVHEIRGCYYEFALRHEDPRTGALFDGFVTSSADKIFESTDVRRDLGDPA